MQRRNLESDLKLERHNVSQLEGSAFDLSNFVHKSDKKKLCIYFMRSNTA